ASSECFRELARSAEFSFSACDFACILFGEADPPLLVERVVLNASQNNGIFLAVINLRGITGARNDAVLVSYWDHCVRLSAAWANSSAFCSAIARAARCRSGSVCK